MTQVENTTTKFAGSGITLQRTILSGQIFNNKLCTQFQKSICETNLQTNYRFLWKDRYILCSQSNMKHTVARVHIIVTLCINTSRVQQLKRRWRRQQLYCNQTRAVNMCLFNITAQLERSITLNAWSGRRQTTTVTLTVAILCSHQLHCFVYSLIRAFQKWLVLDLYLNCIRS